MKNKFIAKLLSFTIKITTFHCISLYFFPGQREAVSLQPYYQDSKTVIEIGKSETVFSNLELQDALMYY